MAEEEIVHRSVPIAGELVPGDAVPPICVESAVGEVGEFREEIENTLPDDIPALPHRVS